MMPYPNRHAFGNFSERIGRVLSLTSARGREAMSPDRYRPEKHYMRGPGPKNVGQNGLKGHNSQT
jgi:hypothetical protein